MCFFFKQKTAYEMRISDWSSGVCSSDLRPEWFDLLEAHGFAGRGRIDAHGSAGSTAAWLPLRTEKPAVFAGLTNWYSFSIRPLFTGEDRRIDAARALFADLRRNAARLTLYPVSETPELAVALRGAGWWGKEKQIGR